MAPSHIPYDCVIELIFNTILLTGCLYNVAWPQCKTMEKYFSDSPATGIIQALASQVSADFFYIEEKRYHFWGLFDINI